MSYNILNLITVLNSKYDKCRVGTSTNLTLWYSINTTLSYVIW